MTTTERRPAAQPSPLPTNLAVVDAANHGVRLELWCGSGEWSALYANGRLIRYGDHDNVLETLAALVTTAHCGEDRDDYLLGGLGCAADVAENTDLIEQYRQVRESREQRAADLERQAASMAADAERLRHEAASLRTPR